MSGYSKKSLHAYEGQFGEVLARKYLQKEGFEVWSYMVLVQLIKHSLMPGIVTHAHDFLGSKKQDFIEMNKTLDQIYSGKEHKRRRFDFIAKKEDKYYVVEVKTNKAILTKFQKEDLQLSKKFGFIPILVRTKVKLIADYKNVTITTL